MAEFSRAMRTTKSFHLSSSPPGYRWAAAGRCGRTGNLRRQKTRPRDLGLVRRARLIYRLCCSRSIQRTTWLR